MRARTVASAVLSTLAMLLAAPGCATDAPEVVDTPREASLGATDKYVVPGKELVITDLSVVEDASRTLEPCAGAAPAGGALGAWTFGRLVQEMAGPHDPSAFVSAWLTQWAADQTVNGYLVPGRALVHDLVLDPWLARSGGAALDLSKAPFRLLAVTSRLDLGRAKQGIAGEGRFVFGVVHPEDACRKLPFTVIFEYALPSDGTCDVKQWATRWHALGGIPFGPEYNAALQALTDDFIQAGAVMGRPNGSALNQIRTNEKALGSPWELREFRVGGDGLLHEATVKQTPDMSYQGSALLADFINANAEAIQSGKHVVPDAWLGGAAPTPFSLVWSAPNVADADARHAFALSTCNGCHRTETGTLFTHVNTRQAGQESTLSTYLTGGIVSDPATGALREFDELRFRAKRLEKLAKMKCDDPASVDEASQGERNLPH